MKIQLISVGNRMPLWVDQGFAEYAKRLPPECALKLIEVPAVKRVKSQNVEQIIRKESQALLSKVSSNAHVVSLDVKGRAWDTLTLSRRLKAWLASGRNIELLVGGPEGLSTECKERANESWSLSPLTLPHTVVRVVVAEALYRAWSILCSHPYHRA